MLHMALFEDAPQSMIGSSLCKVAKHIFLELNKVVIKVCSFDESISHYPLIHEVSKAKESNF